MERWNINAGVSRKCVYGELIVGVFWIYFIDDYNQI